MKKKVFVSRAKKLRKVLTDEEKILWSMLNKRSEFIVKFRRQHVVEPYILDFYSPMVKVAIELDGAQHADPKKIEYDKSRTAFLQHKGILVLRFWNNEIRKELNRVMDYLWQVCEERLSK